MPQLAQILDIPELGLVLYGERAWLDRPVGLSTVTELDNPSPWLQGGELVMTTGLRLTTAERQRAWVRRLARADVAAIGFATGLTHAAVPPAILEAAAANSLAILEVPYETPFVAVARWMGDAVASTHVNQLAELLEAHDEMTAELLGGRGLNGLAAALSMRLNASVAILDEQGRILASQPQHEAWPVEAVRARLFDLRPGANLVEIFEGRHQQVIAHPVRIEGRTIGALLTTATTSSDSVDGLKNFAVALISLELRRRHGIRLGQQGQIGQVVEDLVRSAITTREAERRLHAVGVRASGTRRVLLGTTDAAPKTIRSLPAPLLGPDVDPDATVVSAIVDRCAVLLCPTEALAAEAAPAALAALRRVGPRARVGIGGSYTGVEGLRWSYLEAREALDRGPGIHHGDPLNLHRLLFNSPDLPVRELSEATLAPLLEADRRREGQDLLTTLRTYLELDGSVQATAEAMYVHRNTIHQRLGRIEKLTNRSVSRTQDRVQFWLALAAHDRPHDGPQD